MIRTPRAASGRQLAATATSYRRCSDAHHKSLGIQTPVSGTAGKVSWSVTTAAWSGVAIVLPFNNALPQAVRGLWFAAIGALICVPILLLRVSRPLFPAVWVYAGFASCVSLVLAGTSNGFIENSFVGVQLILLLGFGVFVLTYSASIDENFVQRVGVAFLIGQSLSATIAFSQLASGQSLLVPKAVTWGRASGLAEHQNTLGLMCSLAILVAFRVLVVTRKHRILVFASVAANLLGLVGSGSLTAIIGLFVGFIVMALSMRESLGMLIVSGCAFLATLWSVASVTGVLNYLPSLSGRYKEVTGQTEATSSWEVRRQTYEFAWHSIVRDPVYGTGLNARYGGTFNGVTMAHNGLLRAWYQGGIFLAVAFGLITVAILILIVRAIIQKKYSCEASLLSATLVFASLNPLLEQRQIWLPILMAWASASASAVKDAEHASSPLDRFDRSIT